MWFDINQDIFLPIRESQKKIHEKHEEKEKILADIENPPETKWTFRTSGSASTPHSKAPYLAETGGPKGEGTLPAILRESAPVHTPEDIMEKKMEETVRIPMSRTRVGQSDKQGYDPYREQADQN